MQSNWRGSAKQMQQIAALFDHLVSAREQRGWHIETERFGGLDVDHELVLGWQLHRKIGWLLALEDAVDVGGRAPIQVDSVRSVRHQAAFGDVVASGVDRGQSVLRRKPYDQVAMCVGHRTPEHDQTPARPARETSDAGLDIAAFAYRERAHLHPQ